MNQVNTPFMSVEETMEFLRIPKTKYARPEFLRRARAKKVPGMVVIAGRRLWRRDVLERVRG